MVRKKAEGRREFRDQGEADAFVEKLQHLAGKYYRKNADGSFLKPLFTPLEFKPLEKCFKETQSHMTGHVANACRKDKKLFAVIKEYVHKATGSDQFHIIGKGTYSLVLGTGPDENGVDHVVHIGRLYKGNFLNRPDSHLMLPAYEGKSSLKDGVDLKDYVVEVVPKVLMLEDLIRNGELSDNDPETGLNETAIIYASLYRGVSPEFFPEDLSNDNIAIMPNGLPIISDPNALQKGEGVEVEGSQAAEFRTQYLLDLSPERMAEGEQLVKSMAPIPAEQLGVSGIGRK